MTAILCEGDHGHSAHTISDTPLTLSAYMVLPTWLLKFCDTPDAISSGLRRRYAHCTD